MSTTTLSAVSQFFSPWDTKPASLGDCWCLGDGQLKAQLVGGGYIAKLPTDPGNFEKTGGPHYPIYLGDGPDWIQGYMYQSNDPQKYILGTNLEQGINPYVAYPDHPEVGNYQIRVGY